MRWCTDSIFVLCTTQHSWAVKWFLGDSMGDFMDDWLEDDEKCLVIMSNILVVCTVPGTHDELRGREEKGVCGNGSMVTMDMVSLDEMGVSFLENEWLPAALHPPRWRLKLLLSWVDPLDDPLDDPAQPEACGW